MSKINIADIREALQAVGWELLSTEYTNLNEILRYRCPEGHEVYGTWKKFRDTEKIKCPVCEKNQYSNMDIKPVLKKADTRRILALDQASHTTGWAVYDDTTLIKYGFFEAGDGSEIERCHRVKMWLLAMVRAWKPDFVGLEDIQFQEMGGGHTMGVTVFQTLAHLQGILMETLYEDNVNFELCNTNTWRHQVGVKGRTRADKKKSMQLKVKEWHDVTVSDDCADAIGIGYYLSHKLNKNYETVNWE